MPIRIFTIHLFLAAAGAITGDAAAELPKPKAAAPAGLSAITVQILMPTSGLRKLDVTRCVVYLATEMSPHGPEPSLRRPSIGQRAKKFVPEFTVVPLGTTIEFPNWDRFSHNVFSRSAAAPPFDLNDRARLRAAI